MNNGLITSTPEIRREPTARAVSPAGSAPSSRKRVVPRCILETALRVLSYLPPAEKLLNQQKRKKGPVDHTSRFKSKKPDVDPDFLRFVKQSRMIRPEDVAPLRQLKVLFRDCRAEDDPHPWFSLMWHHYFPPATTPIKYEKNNYTGRLPNDMTLEANIRGAAATAGELLKTERFFKKPFKKWPECKLIKKGELYIGQLNKDAMFARDFLDLYRSHGRWLGKQLKKEPVIRADFRMYDATPYLELPPDTPPEKRRAFDIARFCDRFGLIGFSRYAPFFIPNLFSVSTDLTTLYLCFGRHIGIDWNRDLPGDMLNILANRRTMPVPRIPRRLSDTSGTGLWAAIDRDTFVARYYELACSKPRPPKKEVYLTLAKEFKIHAPPSTGTDKVGEESTRNRVMDRQLRTWGVPPFSQDPKIH